MAKNILNFKCTSCGNRTSKWAGQCPSCSNWNTIEELFNDKFKNLRVMDGNEFFSLRDSKVDIDRLSTGMTELDLVLGGGLVPGASMLIGGEPGIGKSTVLMQVALGVALQNETVHYYSGEESKTQILIRAKRLNISHKNIKVSTLAQLEEIEKNIEKDIPKLVILDSIQTSKSDKVEGIPGSINQIKYACQELTSLCKLLNISLFIVGHITKDGQLAGPKTIEHMVDTVLYFENDKGNDLRLIRTAKNRYGSSSEIGIFKMTNDGLCQVSNPLSLFLSNSNTSLNGTSIFPAAEGSRIILLEIQALVAQSSFSTAKRTVVGWDGAKLSMLLAVLESRCGISFSNKDIYLNIAGGVRTTDPAADLAVVAALISAKQEFPIREKIVFFGEVNLSGTIRESHKTDVRIRESEKLGFKKAIISKNAKVDRIKTIEIEKITHLNEFISCLKNQ